MTEAGDATNGNGAPVKHNAKLLYPPAGGVRAGTQGNRMWPLWCGLPACTPSRGRLTRLHHKG
jgi:hypothetical protein